MPSLLTIRLPTDADAARVADTMVAIWQDIDAALHPVVGHRGVAALYDRSRTLAAGQHPWLGIPPSDGPLAELDTTALHAALLGQSAVDATAGGDAQLNAFSTLLASLMGSSLTERLLRPVWAHTTGDSSAQDSDRP